MNRLKVLLVQSYLGGREPLVAPLGLALLASAVSGECEVETLDLNLEERPFQALRQRIDQFEPEVVGISLRNIDSTNKRQVTFYYQYLKPTLKVVAKSPERPVIVLGGAGFSMFAEQIMQDAGDVDFGVFLEAEESFPELLKNLDRPQSVQGIYYRNGSDCAFTGYRPPPDLSKLPVPRWDLFDLQRYKGTPHAFGIETKRGCPLSCAYCPYPFLNGRRYRLKSVGRVVDEIEELHLKYGIEEFAFVDSVFNIPLAQAKSICRELIDRKLKLRWSAWFNEKHLSVEFLSLAKEAGCENFIFSPDGFSDAVLTGLQKNIRKNDILKAYAMLSKVKGIKVSYNFFKNPPKQTLGTVLEMFLFFMEARMRFGRGRVGFELSSLRIEPHTPLYRQAEKEGWIANGKNLLHPTFYKNPETRSIEKAIDLLLWLKGK